MQSLKRGHSLSNADSQREECKKNAEPTKDNYAPEGVVVQGVSVVVPELANSSGLLAVHVGPQLSKPGFKGRELGVGYCVFVERSCKDPLIPFVGKRSAKSGIDCSLVGSKRVAALVDVFHSASRYRKRFRHHS